MLYPVWQRPQRSPPGSNVIVGDALCWLRVAITVSVGFSRWCSSSCRCGIHTTPAGGQHVIELALHVEGGSSESDADSFRHSKPLPLWLSMDDRRALYQLIHLRSTIVCRGEMIMYCTTVRMRLHPPLQRLTSETNVVSVATPTGVVRASKMVNHIGLVLVSLFGRGAVTHY